jgi:hypothetical protein
MNPDAWDLRDKTVPRLALIAEAVSEEDEQTEEVRAAQREAEEWYRGWQFDRDNSGDAA